MIYQLAFHYISKSQIGVSQICTLKKKIDDTPLLKKTMETIVKKFRIGLLHFGFWALYGFLLFMVYNFMVQGKVSTNREILYTVFTWFLFLPALASYLVYYFILFPRYRRHTSVKKSIGAAVLISIAIALVFTVALEFALNVPWSIERLYSVTFSLFVFEAIHCSIVGGIAFIIRAFHQWFSDQKLQLNLQEKNHQMQLELIKAQLDPHFLFNSLNNIDVLILQEPKKASEYLNMLSDILRHSLRPELKASVSLTEEVTFMEKYIALQKIRISKKDAVQFEVKGDLEGHSVAPFLFVPFLENAFKYHAYSSDKAIQISITIENNILNFRCANRIAEKYSTHLDSFKIGQDLIRKRLNLLYASKHDLRISEEGGIYEVTLKLQ